MYLLKITVDKQVIYLCELFSHIALFANDVYIVTNHVRNSVSV